ncbi:hypothetical protein [Streptomyces hygroscopicus]|uniref:hypothetical protein n=1 Tax=Streptomyces hygroscopicus TaxID=1912 RepID=UPI00224086D7|nr:hypothetical protein [Streptomyces hygroscopicus]
MSDDHVVSCLAMLTAQDRLPGDCISGNPPSPGAGREAGTVPMAARQVREGVVAP